MKIGIIIAGAASVGCLIAFWLFVLAFNMSTQNLNQAAIIPIMVAFGSAFILSAAHPSTAKLSATGIATPVLILNTFFFLMVLIEGRGPDWTHITSAIKVIVAVVCGAMAGIVISRIIKSLRAG